MKISERQLRHLIREVLEERELDEMSTAQAKVEGPLKDFIASMEQAKQALGKSGAKKALGVLYQQTDDKNAGAKAEQLLGAVNKIENSIDTVIKWLDKMPQLTQDPWAHVRKRD